MSEIVTVTKRPFWRSYPSVNTRITVPFLLAIIAIAAIGIFTVTRLVAGSIQERLTNQLVASATAAANTIVDIETDSLNALRLMVFTEGVADAILGGRTSDLDQWLRPIAATDLVDELVVVDDSSEVLLYLRRQDSPQVIAYDSPPAPDVANWENLQRTIDGDVDTIGDKFVDVKQSPDGNLVMYFNAPVVIGTENPRVIGAIAVGLRFETIVSIVSQQALSAITLLSDEGNILASSFRTEASQQDVAQIERSADAARVMISEVQDNSPVENVTIEGTPYQMLFSPFIVRSQQIGLLVVGLPADYIVDQSSTSRDLFGVIFATFFFIVGLIGLLISRTITNPIRRLVNTTRAIRAGDLSRRVKLEPRDELGELGVSFDIMTDQLVTRNQEVTVLLEQQVQETAQREAVLVSISDAVIVQDTDGKIILRNHTAEQLMEFAARVRRERDLIANLLRYPRELLQPKMVSIAGRHFSVLATPVMMTDETLLGHVIVFRDITAIIQSEQIKDEMVLQMSHELRTPLGAVRGYVDLIKLVDAARLSQQGLQFVDNAREGLSTLERLVNQVIDVSAMISNRFHVDITTMNLAYLLGDVFMRWQPIMKERELQFTLMLSNNDMYIEGDETRLDELIDHVLRNSHSYTLPGGMVEMSAEMTRTHAIITIADSGKGISADEIDRVFERMYRGRAAMAGDTDARGLGLGLYISRQIVEGHHGHIRVESEPGLGTIVTIELPIKQSAIQ